MASLSDYTVEEIVAMSLWQRLSLYPWKIEFFAIGVMVAYFVIYKVGAAYNDKIATNFINSTVPVLKENFFQVGVTQKELYAKDDDQHFSFYASGRTRIESMIAKIELQARQNIFMWVIESVVSFFFEAIPSVDDIVTVEFQFDEEASEKFDNFIWAVVTKDKMDKYRNDNYYLSLSKTSESTKLPNQFVFMNEVPEMSDVLFTKKLSDHIAANVSTLRYMAITDQPSDKPFKIAELKPSKKLIMQFNLASNDAQLDAITKMFNYITNDYLDLIVNRATFRPELTRKVKKTRETEYSKLKKMLDEAKKEELYQQKVEEQKKLRASMTPQEQQKLAKKQQDKKQRKQLNRQKVRGSM